jgi:hypothetical protein
MGEDLGRKKSGVRSPESEVGRSESEDAPEQKEQIGAKPGIFHITFFCPTYFLFFLLDQKEPKNQDCLNFLYFLRFKNPRKQTPQSPFDDFVKQCFLSAGHGYFSALENYKKIQKVLI